MEKLAIEHALFPADVLLDLTMAGSVLSRYGANQVILYGSMARGDYRTDSDIDLCALTYECLGYYNAIEHLMIRFLKYLSIELPTGKFSHRDTLRQFNILLSERNITDSQETVVIITNLMAFRHVATKIYGFLIDAEKLNVIVEDINTHHSEIEKIFYKLLETF